MLLGSSRNGRIKVTQLSVPTTCGTVSVTQRDALCKTSGLTAPGSQRAKGIGGSFNEPILLLFTDLPNVGLNPQYPVILKLDAC